MKILLIMSLVFTFSSCGTAKKKLSKDGAKVKVLTHRQGHGCSVVDKVVGENEIGSLELAENHTRNLVADAGGDAVYYNETVRNSSFIKVYGTAFKCNKDD